MSYLQVLQLHVREPCKNGTKYMKEDPTFKNKDDLGWLGSFKVIGNVSVG